MNLDEAIQRVLIAVGLLTFGFAVLLVVDTGLAAGLPFGGELVVGVGVLALVLGLAAARSRLRGDLTETAMPDPELPSRNPAPGDEIDRLLYEMVELRYGTMENREQIEERLRSAAVRMIQQRYSCSRPEAVRRLESGEWTDNETAADFFIEDQSFEDEGSAFERILSDDDGAAEFERRVEETVDALAALGEHDFERDRSADSSSLLDSLVGQIRGGDEEETVETNWNAEESSIDSFRTDERFVDAGVNQTNRWLGVSAFSLVAFGFGVFLSRPGLLLAGTIGVGYAAYARAAVLPNTDDLLVERTLSDEEPSPGDAVQVQVTIRNTGETMLPDLRMVDIVPDPFVVTHGSPRLCTSLRPGKQASFTYTVVVERGEYSWPLLVAARDFSGATERNSLITPESSLQCVPPLAAEASMPVRAQTTQYAGDVDTERGGSGLEFYSVREYREGDPMKRINWKHFARTGDLATIDFRQEKAATVTLLFDTRQRAYSSRGPGEPHAVDLAVNAATDVFTSLYDAGNLVGVAAFDTVPCWLAPGASTDHVERARLLFATHPALSPIPPDRDDIEGSYIDPMTHVRRQLPSHSQIFMFSPLSDDYAAEAARRLDSAGHLVTIISPDTTTDDTVGQRLATIERSLRLNELRERNIRAIDWKPEDRLDLQFKRAQARWA